MSQTSPGSDVKEPSETEVLDCFLLAHAQIQSPRIDHALWGLIMDRGLTSRLGRLLRREEELRR